MLETLFYSTLAVYGAALGLSLFEPRYARYLLAAGCAIHFAATFARGWAIEFFPLTNKLESFSAAALALAIVTVVTWRDVRLYVVPLLALVCAALYAALSFPHDLSFPPPLMQTIWYPLHVPLSFFAYALWAAAAAAGAVWLLQPAVVPGAKGESKGDPTWLARVDRLALYGFALWSVSMICGGIWGVVAWGAYFMWDVKIIWSVILWFHYASFIHLRLTPSLFSRPWLRPALALLGFAWVLVAYVGTSFFFGRSSHAF